MMGKDDNLVANNIICKPNTYRATQCSKREIHNLFEGYIAELA
jgi:hypothetical protein